MTGDVEPDSECEANALNQSPEQNARKTAGGLKREKNLETWGIASNLEPRASNLKRN